MDSRWSDIDARRAVDHYAGQGYGPDVALRVYTTRLLGADPKLVLHGGGNTSVKTVAADLLGDEVEVLCVKGSGWDMAEIEPPGLPAVRLDPLRRLRRLDTLSDEDMVDFERQNLLDSRAPTPSVEALLHAFLPHKFVDHTHSTAVLSLTNQPDGEALCRDLLGDRVGIVPVHHAGVRPGQVGRPRIRVQHGSPRAGAAEARAVHVRRDRQRGVRGDDRHRVQRGAPAGAGPQARLRDGADAVEDDAGRGGRADPSRRLRHRGRLRL